MTACQATDCFSMPDVAQSGEGDDGKRKDYPHVVDDGFHSVRGKL